MGQTREEAIFMFNNLGRKQCIADSLGGNQIWLTVLTESENWRISLYRVLNDLDEKTD